MYEMDQLQIQCLTEDVVNTLSTGYASLITPATFWAPENAALSAATPMAYLADIELGGRVCRELWAHGVERNGQTVRMQHIDIANGTTRH